MFHPFQSTRPQGARRCRSGGFFVADKFQSTRPQGARHGDLIDQYDLTPVSIHAPARGATPVCRRTSSCRRFNPRARKGRDRPSTPTCTKTDVSIHAPARGATFAGIKVTEILGEFQSTRPQGARRCPAQCPSRGTSSFNPRARKGRDPTQMLPIGLIEPFQSTRPQGARLTFKSKSLSTPCFNPRARKGRDRRQRIQLQNIGVSIHAPARGAT